MKRNLQQKLKSYSLTAGTLTLAVSGSAQINYTDANPDIIVENNNYQYDFDIDGDGTNELGFYVYSSSGNGYATLRLSTSSTINAIRGTQSSSFSTPEVRVLNSGDSIRPAANDWRTDSYQYLGIYTGPSTIYGNWNGVADKYMAIQFEISGQTHYGWVRMTVTPGSDTLIIKDYAYNSSPGLGLTAGEGLLPTSVNSLEVQNPQVLVFDQTLFVNLPAQTAIEGNIQLFNSAGQLVKSITITDSAMRIALSELPIGIYFVQIQQNGVSTSRKVYIH